MVFLFFVKFCYFFGLGIIVMFEYLNRRFLVFKEFEIFFREFFCLRFFDLFDFGDVIGEGFVKCLLLGLLRF